MNELKEKKRNEKLEKNQNSFDDQIQSALTLMFDCCVLYFQKSLIVASALVLLLIMAYFDTHTNTNTDLFIFLSTHARPFVF